MFPRGSPAPCPAPSASARERRSLSGLTNADEGVVTQLHQAVGQGQCDMLTGDSRPPPPQPAEGVPDWDDEASASRGTDGRRAIGLLL